MKLAKLVKLGVKILWSIIMSLICEGAWEKGCEMKCGWEASVQLSEIQKCKKLMCYSSPFFYDPSHIQHTALKCCSDQRTHWPRKDPLFNKGYSQTLPQEPRCQLGSWLLVIVNTCSWGSQSGGSQSAWGQGADCEPYFLSEQALISLATTQLPNRLPAFLLALWRLERTGNQTDLRICPISPPPPSLWQQEIIVVIIFIIFRLWQPPTQAVCGD
jgi:hypothetical protein